MIDPFDIPPEIIRAANQVSTYMATKGYRDWELCGLCDRSFAVRAKDSRPSNWTWQDTGESWTWQDST